MKSGAVWFMPVHAQHFATRNDKKSAFSSHFSFGQGFLIIVLGVQPFVHSRATKKYPYSIFLMPFFFVPENTYCMYGVYIVCIRFQKLPEKNGQPDAKWQLFRSFPTHSPCYHHSICSSPKCLQTQLKAARNCHVFGTVGGFLSSSGDVACGRCPLSSSDISDRWKHDFRYTKLSTSISLYD